MRLSRLGPVGQEIPTVEVDETRYDLRPITDDINGAFLSLDGVQRTRDALASGILSELANARTLRIGAPLGAPGKIVCIGLNYRDHVQETRAETPIEPVIFMKDPSTIVGPNDTVYIPRASMKTDWEVELGVVIGTTARYLDSPADARKYIAGYVLSHDVSEREFQIERGGQWDKGKSCETFNPLGPYFVTANQIVDPQNLGLRLWVNGTQRQNGSTTNMIFGVDHLIWYLSQFMVLRPGDLINTGTPAGVALGLANHPYLRAGDVVELEIDQLGQARQRFAQA